MHNAAGAHASVSALGCWHFRMLALLALLARPQPLVCPAAVRSVERLVHKVVELGHSAVREADVLGLEKVLQLLLQLLRPLLRAQCTGQARQGYAGQQWVNRLASSSTSLRTASQEAHRLHLNLVDGAPVEMRLVQLQLEALPGVVPPQVLEATQADQLLHLQPPAGRQLA